MPIMVEQIELALPTLDLQRAFEEGYKHAASAFHGEYGFYRGERAIWLTLESVGRVEHVSRDDAAAAGVEAATTIYSQGDSAGGERQLTTEYVFRFRAGLEEIR